MFGKLKTNIALISNWSLLITALLMSVFISSNLQAVGNNKWVSTWSTAQQLVEERNNPPISLSNNTLRQVVHVSIGGDNIRVSFSNMFSKSAVTMKSVHVAVSSGGGVIDKATDTQLTFNGNAEYTMDPESEVTSDPFPFKILARSDIAITILFGETSPDVTGHPGSRTTSYIYNGDGTLLTDLSSSTTTDHWYVIDRIDVLASGNTHAVAVVGNSITDGRGSGTNKQNRWPDELAKRLHENPETQNVAVVNQGIGGNCVLRYCLGPSALDRFDRDVLKQSGVKWVILFEGINDIGQAGNLEIADKLISAYEEMIKKAHSAGLIIYGATILPFKDSFYDSEDHQTIRSKVNEWIRTSGKFDAVIDLDLALRDPENPLKLLHEADSGDHLHPSETGHRLIAEAVDLSLFK